MAQVTQYQIRFYGGQNGYANARVQIALYGSQSQQPVGLIRFWDPGMTPAADSESNGMITMHLPSATLQSVLDVLRNEKPLNFHFPKNTGFLETQGSEPVGEGE